MNIVILGLSITSSWGNGHATTYRGLVRGLAALGHEVLFLERDVPWYAGNRDAPHPPGARTELYQDFQELERWEREIVHADFVIVGSFVPEGAVIGQWVTSVARGITAFYDIDTPVTIEKLSQGTAGYITPELVRAYDLYLSFTGGPTPGYIERTYGARMVRPLYCFVDPAHYFPIGRKPRWDLGYLGTYSQDRQPGLESLMLEPARREPGRLFTVAGPLYPATIDWPSNVKRTIHLSPREHPVFYGSQKFTLNITRDAMKRAGYSPSVRLFEAGACGVAIISDWWAGLETIFTPDREILISDSPDDTLRHLRDVSDDKRLALASAARRRVLSEHTPEIRAAQLESYVAEARTLTAKPTAVCA